MIFGLDIIPVQAVLLEISLAATLVSLGVFLLKIMPVSRRRARCDEDAARATALRASREGASIIVYSVDEASRLEELLPQLLAQQYDAEYEVIVVNEGDSLQVTQLVADMQLQHRNLYLTHTPDGARNLSRKKLALTLGIKAARYPVVVLTAADAVIDSPHWLALMMSNFSPDSHIEVVLGYACAAPYDDRAFGSRTRSFDFVADSAMWIADALAGHPWRGTEFNLAYRRELFFRSKGFSSNLNLRDGDDDIFISRVATASNTAVELAMESIVEVPGYNSPASARRRDIRRRFTRRFIRRRPRFLARLGWSCYTIALLLPLAAIAIPPYTPASIAAGVAVLCCWYPAGLVWRRAMTALCGRRLLFTLPFLAATRVPRQMLRCVFSRFRHAKRYTWE